MIHINTYLIKSMKKNLITLIVFICCISATYAQLIPAPESFQLNKGNFVLDANTGMHINSLDKSESSKLTKYLIDKIETATSVRVSSKKARKKNISLEILRQPNLNLGEEGYLLNISTTEIHIAANSYAGLFYGAQSLLQYIIANNTQTPLQLPCLSVSDKPNDLARNGYGCEQTFL